MFFFFFLNSNPILILMEPRHSNAKHIFGVCNTTGEKSSLSFFHFFFFFCLVFWAQRCTSQVSVGTTVDIALVCRWRGFERLCAYVGRRRWAGGPRRHRHGDRCGARSGGLAKAKRHRRVTRTLEPSSESPSGKSSRVTRRRHGGQGCEGVGQAARGVAAGDGAMGIGGVGASATAGGAAVGRVVRALHLPQLTGHKKRCGRAGRRNLGGTDHQFNIAWSHWPGANWNQRWLRASPTSNFGRKLQGEVKPPPPRHGFLTALAERRRGCLPDTIGPRRTAWHSDWRTRHRIARNCTTIPDSRSAFGRQRGR